ncbi:MAG: SDR family NAD(P)-dependent oxidoreductase [Anaerolineales bacterium]|nr:SDR family NAD(P)-dependent oxidoreductase [Anaerolineales bacterium]
MGRELAIQLIRKGARVAAADINPDTLAETSLLVGSDALSTHVVNISDRARVEAFPEEVIGIHGAVDVLINNAGIVQPFLTINALTIEQIERVFSVNWSGVLYMTKAFLPHLKKRPEAHLLNVSSMGGFVPVPGQVAYGASKAAVKLFTEGLMSEYAGTNLGVTIAFPGSVATNITQNAPDITKEDLERLAATASEGDPPPTISAAFAAGEMIKAIEQGKQRIYIGKDSQTINLYSRLFPAGAAEQLRKMLIKAIGPIRDEA